MVNCELQTNFSQTNTIKMTEKKVVMEPKDGVVTIYEGKAIELKHPEKVVIKGDFNAVKNFIAKRGDETSELQKISLAKSVIVTNIEAGTITLETNPNDVFGTEVTAIIELHPNLKAFGINAGKAYSQNDFVKLLKVNRRFFNPEKYNNILQKYAAFVVKGSTENTLAVKDQRGASKNAFDKTVDTGDLPLDFDLNIPIFKGGEKELFNVLVFVESVEKVVSFTLESIDLIELLESRKEALFAEQIENDFAGILVINK